MKYRNKKTGSIIDVECKLIDELYELVDEKIKEEVSEEETSSEALEDNTPAPKTTKEPAKTTKKAKK